MYTLIAFASQWGSKYGGINCFNTDFLEHFSAAYSLQTQIICIVTSATEAEISQADDRGIKLIALSDSTGITKLHKVHAPDAIEKLKKHGISYEPANTIWLGHDLISGGAAIAAAEQAGGRSALIHHMSYDDYESFAEDSQIAHDKTQQQTTLFTQADLILAVGPLLRDAISQKVDSEKMVHMLIPGLVDLEPRDTPKTFRAFLSGRLSDDAARIKQGHLAIAAVATAHKQAREQGSENGLQKKPTLLIRGVDFEAAPKEPSSDPETKIKQFAEEYAGAVINIQALPYTQDRTTLYNDLCGSTVAMMPSWHEGFGLVAWEAIAAGVPLILGKNSGVYQFLEDEYTGIGTGCVYPIDVLGSTQSPFFRGEDLTAVSKALSRIANSPVKAKKQAASLRELLNKHTWANCAEEAVQAFAWPLQKGSIPPTAVDVPVTEVTLNNPDDASNDNPLQIPQKQRHAGRPLTDSQMLRAEEALVPFDLARKPELDALNKWMDDTDYPEAIRLMTGAGGLGKTRLALELCQQRITMGWQAGLLESELTTKDIEDKWQQLIKGNQPSLIVLDYAETRQNSLLILIKAMLDYPAQHPVRILLLARDGGEWWNNLAAKDSRCEPLLSGYATCGPYVLPALYRETSERQIAYQQALSAFAEALNVTPPKINPELTAEYFGRPLYLQMAALLALHGEQPSSAQGLTNALLNHEYRYWQGLFKHIDIPDAARHAQQLLALATLAGGYVTSKEALNHWTATNGSLLNPAQFNQLFNALVPLYPGKQGLQAIRPDLLGEALVARTLLQSDGDALLNTVLGKSSQQMVRSHALTVFARLTNQHSQLNEILINGLAENFLHCCPEFVAVSKETPSQLPVLATLVFSQLKPVDKGQVAGILEPLLQEESIELTPLNCEIKEYLVNKAERKIKKKPRDIQSQANYARALSQYSVALDQAGKSESGLLPSKQALKICKQLVQKQADRYEEDLSIALNNHARLLAELGQYETAKRYAEQELGISEHLAGKQLDRYEPGYATSLSNYASHLSDTGEFEEANDYAKQALDIRKRLAEKQPDRYESDYATSLSNYANHLSDTGEFEEANDYAKQALDIRKRLTEKQPDRYEPYYAISLNNYANHLSDTGEFEEANDYAKQALDIRKRLAEKQPDRYEPYYATSLSNYASHLSDTGEFEEANDYAKQALDIRKRLIEKQPDCYESDYATSLSNYASNLSNMDQFEEAESYAEQALGILKRLAEKYPARYSEDLFNAQYNLSQFSWLLNKPVKSESLVVLTRTYESIPEHAQVRYSLYKAFLQGCITDVHSERKSAFQQVVILWPSLSLVNKISAEQEFLCVCAWCATHASEELNDHSWQTLWQKYLAQRQGNISHEMQAIAERLDFQWPARG